MCKDQNAVCCLVSALKWDTYFVLTTTTIRSIGDPPARKYCARLHQSYKDVGREILSNSNVTLYLQRTLWIMMTITDKYGCNTPWFLYQLKMIWYRKLSDPRVPLPINLVCMSMASVALQRSSERPAKKIFFLVVGRFMSGAKLAYFCLTWLSICLRKLIIRKQRIFSHETHFVHHRFS